MRTITFLGLLIAGVISSCTNSASDPNNTAAADSYDSLSVTADTVTQNATNFSAAVHHMMNDLNQIPLTGNVERDFAVTLKSHHQGAVDIAQAEIQSGSDAALKEVAQRISSIQKTEITELEKFVESLRNGPVKVTTSNKNKDGAFSTVLKKHKAMMWDMSKMDTTMAADQQFVAAMIPHLQSGLYLAEGFLQYGKDAKLRAMAEEMIRRKQKQLAELQAWANKNKGLR